MLWYLLLALLIVAGGVFLFGPQEPVDRVISFDPKSLPDDLDRWLAEAEATVPDLKEGVAKRIVWAGEPGAKTPLSVVYVHGFSATSEEIRPVPDRVATELGANLHFTRLAGHGRDGAAMTDLRAGDWIEDMAEAIEIGRRIGERVIVIGTSTGGTLTALAATDPDLSADLAGVVLVSPNFALANPAAQLLKLPWVRHWGPIVAGSQRSFVTHNEDHAKFWTSTYPTVATIPMSALADHVLRRDFTLVEVPALFLYAQQDEVVIADVTHQVFSSWGAPRAREMFVMGPGDDPASHVIAGDILSPGQTDKAVEAIVRWAQGL